VNAVPICVGVALCAAAAVALAGVSVTPAGDSVPANLLRIELRLDAPLNGPLNGPLNMRHVHLLDQHGAEIPAPFLDLALPSLDGRTITVLLHPGRIKTDVRPNVDLGPVLHVGQRVVLLIDDPQLPAPVRKAWSVTADQRSRIDPDAWLITPPAAGTCAPLQVAALGLLQSSAQHWIGVADTQGRKLAGTARLSEDGATWQFKPAHAWRSGQHRLQLHPALEDAAGNRVCAAFEQGQLRDAPCSIGAARSFVVRPGR
jgi:hypothetical protein